MGKGLTTMHSLLNHPPSLIPTQSPSIPVQSKVPCFLAFLLLKRITLILSSHLGLIFVLGQILHNIAPGITSQLEFSSVNERVGSLCFQVRGRVLTVVCANALMCQSQFVHSYRHKGTLGCKLMINFVVMLSDLCIT